MKLEDILVAPLARIDVKGGDVLHALKCSDPGYNGFGEAYFSFISTGAIKAWKQHTRMVMNLIVPTGEVRFVFCLHTGSNKYEFRVEDLGPDSYSRITVPPGIWFGFQGLARHQSLILNIANIPHDPSEVSRLKQFEIKFDLAIYT